MKLRITLIGAALVACLAFTIPAQDSRPDDTAKKIEALTKALELQTKRTHELASRLDRIDAWLLTVRTASALLDGAADDARANGFELAGHNAAARTNVLDGMKGFAFEIMRGLPPLPDLPAGGR